MAQRWVIVSSEATLPRAEPRVRQAQKRALDTVPKPLLPWPAKRFETPASAPATLRTLAGAWRSHHVAPTDLTEPKRSVGKGRPSAQASVQAALGQMRAAVGPEAEAIPRHTHHQGCGVRGTHMAASALSAVEVIAA